MAENICLPGENCEEPKEVKKNQLSVKFYWREGCGYCERAKPAVEELKKDFSNIVFKVIDDTERYKKETGFAFYPQFEGYYDDMLISIIGGFGGDKNYILSCLGQYILTPKQKAEITIKKENERELRKCMEEIKPILEKYGCTLSAEPFISKVK